MTKKKAEKTDDGLKNLGGRPEIEIDPEEVLKLAAIHCTMEEMGDILGCSVDTLERRFADIIKKGRSTGRASLRRKQYQLADKGNVTMLIWLGKQLLGQTEKQEVTGTGAQVIIKTMQGPCVTKKGKPKKEAGNGKDSSSGKTKEDK